ncbi:MAG TPA: carboxypeptidase regulatory-like domain-containing protein, partial [Planctomycetota bacterium]|nr:carboxypeptidase regulatory-like domain-containing protein [Planctomycetota bacterium]
MKRLLLPAVLLAAGVAAFFLLQRDDPAPDWATPATTPTADPTAPPATLSGGTTDTSRTDADASTPRAGARTALGERAVHLRIRGRFEADPRLPLSGGVVVVVDREVAGSRRTTGPFGDAYSGLAVLAPHARERGRAEVASDGSFAVEVRTAGEPDQLTVRLDHDHYFLPTLPAIPIGDGSGERDLGSLHPVLGALVIGRLVDFPAPEETTVRLRAEMDMMAPARDPQLFAAQVAGSQRPPVHGRRDGTFALRAVPLTPGANVHAAHGDLIGTSTTFPLTAGETREVTVYAQQATTLLATVRDERGNPVEGAAVEVQATAGAFIGGETARAARTDAAGVAAVRGIVPGDARIHVQCAGFVGARQTE